MKIRTRARVAIVTTLALLSLSGCSAPPKLAGVWQPDDGSATKTIGADGSCTGMYYHQHEPLDIGGNMTCTLGEKSSNRTYPLVVQQPPNQMTYRADFTDDDTLVLSDNAGVIVTLTRQ